MAEGILLAAVAIFACIFANKLSSKMGIPMLLAFILLGMLFGSDGLLKIPFDDFALSEKICSAALIFIMFYGGFGTNWKEARPVASQAILLSSLGVVATMLFTGLFCHFVIRMPLWESFLLGAVISSTDAASVFSILRSKHLNLKYHTASLLEVESGSNDPFSYMLTVIILALMKGKLSGGMFAYLLFAQVFYGLVFGVVIALAARWLLKRLSFPTAGFYAIFILALALLSYALPALLGGNGYISVYLVGIILGNSKLRDKVSLVHFFDGITGLMQMLIFFLLGLLSFPSQLPAVALRGFLIALFLTFIARPAVVALLLTPFGCKFKQQCFISFGGLRGAASIVFAIIAVTDSAIMQHDIFHIVFFLVLFSILFQGSLLPVVAKKLSMTDDEENVMKSFTDYTDELPIQAVRFSLPASHPWVGKAICDIPFPPDTIAVLLKRGSENILPCGSTVLAAHDVLIAGAYAPDNTEQIKLYEKRIFSDSEWVGKTISEVSPSSNELIIMIRRKDQIILPNGQSVIQSGDLLLLSGQ